MPPPSVQKTTYNKKLHSRPSHAICACDSDSKTTYLKHKSNAGANNHYRARASRQSRLRHQVPRDTHLPACMSSSSSSCERSESHDDCMSSSDRRAVFLCENVPSTCSSTIFARSRAISCGLGGPPSCQPSTTKMKMKKKCNNSHCAGAPANHRLKVKVE